ncbi:hypothetical protein [Pseudomonas sp. TH15]|uniref:hypothetical protein n=1 Tax=Pseudomonas sp. TH15 TaxID=2796381 RepID=UPI001913A01C|nr:hypothetical protein [Pseudomonas sp. TH15]MBK5513688.1 hypothetical protein [Pseudomonas sp. TH15]
MINLSGRVIVAWLASVAVTSASAAEKNIEALFRPDSANPQNNEFVNQTPSEGFCLQIPEHCKPEGLFSLIAPIAFRSRGPIQAFHTDPRQGGMAKVPSHWQKIQVEHESGAQETVEIRIAGIGHESGLSEAVTVIVEGQAGDDINAAWYLLWTGGAWREAPPPCLGVGRATLGYHGYNSFWKVPVNAGTCAKQARFTIPAFHYQYFVYGYELRTPKPLTMKSGRYYGSIDYTVGPGMDFDMGDLMIPNDNLLRLNFTLIVEHMLKVEIPPGGTTIELTPQGGWQAWLDQARKPTRLFRDQTFNLWTSSRFKMQMRCQYDAGDTCAVQDPAGNQAPLQVAVTLPAGLTTEGGRAVIRQPLRVSGVGTEMFQPGIYVDRKPGTLHFDIEQGDVANMLSREAATYKGNVTVIWDSEVG